MFKDEIIAGANLLDEKLPEWEGRQDLEKLDLASPCNCVLGQSEDERDYWTTLRKLCPNAQSEVEIDKFSASHGFYINDFDEAFVMSEQEVKTYNQLTQEWKQFITERRKQNVTV